MAKYRMTPRRKAALHKAQLASARKRKSRARHTRNRRLAAAGGVTVLAVTTGALAHRYTTKTARGGPKRPTGPLALMAGRGVTHIPGHGTPGWATEQRIKSTFDLKASLGAQERERTRIGELKKSRRRQRFWQTQHSIPRRNRFTRAAARRRKRGK